MIKAMPKIKITNDDLQEKGSKIICHGVVTDEVLNFYGWGYPNRTLKFVVVKGYIDDWAIYLETMEKSQTIEEIRAVGNKIGDEARIKQLVECSEEILKRYRY